MFLVSVYNFLMYYFYRIISMSKKGEGGVIKNK